MSYEVYRTERLTIRPWCHADRLRFLEMYSNPEVTRFIPSLQVGDETEALENIQALTTQNGSYPSGYGIWAAERRDSHLVVGTVMLKFLPGLKQVLTDDPEVGWHLARDSWGKGYATEMSQGAVDYGFNVRGLNVIYAIADAENTASLNVMKRLGMRYVGPNTTYYDGDERLVYRLDRTERLLDGQ